MSYWIKPRPPVGVTGALLVGALLAGCAAVGPDYVAPEAPIASAYTAPGEALPPQAELGASVAQEWWNLFGSTELDGLVRQALAGNPSLEAARARLSAARQTVLSQSPQLQGDLSAGVRREHVNLAGFGFTGGLGGGQLENPTVSLYSVGAAVSYDFDLFGGARRERESREARARAAEAELQAAYLSLTGQVVTQVVAIAVLTDQIEAAEDLVARDRDLITLTQKGFQGGSGTRLDISAAESQLAADEAALPGLRQQLAVARHALALLLGKTPSDYTPPAFTLEAIALPGRLPLTLPSQLARSRPDIRAAEARLHAATAQIGVAEARLYPDLTLSANLTQSALAPEDIFSPDFSGWSVGPLGVSLPLLNRGSLRAQSKAAAAAADAAATDYRATVLSAFGQIADVLQAIEQDEAAYTAQGRALESAGETLRLNRLRYQGGKSGSQPVIDAQRAFERQRQAYLRIGAQRRLDAAQLLLASGGGWSDTGALRP